MQGLYAILLLIVSNVFMTFAWYGHLKLQEMKWWEWDEETLFEAMPILCSNKIDLLYKFFRKMK